MELILTSPYGLLGLLGGVFYLMTWLRQRLASSLVNPTLLTMIIVIGCLLVLKIPYQAFEHASGYITFWLQPAVVCLAVPLYIQWQKIKSQALAIVLSQVFGSIMGIVSGIMIAKALGGNEAVLLSIAAKSVTMPIAIEVTQNLGGVMGINTLTVLLAGVFGQMMGLGVCAWVHLKKPMSQALAIGTASHALGIASLMPLGGRYVAYGTVGLIVNGILTAFLAPMIAPWLLS